MTKKLALATACLLALCLSHRTATAQSSTTGAISGVVTDAETGETLPGVTIVVTSPSLQGSQSAISDGTGTYKISSLPPGTYEVVYYYLESQVKRSGVSVSINNNTQIYQKINTSAAGGEVIEVEGNPTVDTTSTTQGITLDQDYLQDIPVPGRTFSSALGAAAGTQNDGVGVSFSGSSSLENQYVVDGVNTTGLTYGTVGSPVINDFIQEIEVITGGYQAEYGRSTGGVVNVVTKSGSNEFRGTVFSYFRNSMLTVDAERVPTQAGSIDAVSNLAYDWTFGFDLGGPIIKDKLWFYVGFSPRLIAVDVDRITKRRTDCRMTNPDGSLSECDPTMFGDGVADENEDGLFIFEELDRTQQTSQQTTYYFTSKINYALAPEHQGQVSFTGTPFSNEVLGVTGEPQAVGRNTTRLTTDASVKWTSKFNDNKTEVEAVLGWHRSRFESGSIDENVDDVPAQVLVFGNLGTWGQRGFESMRTIQGCTDANDPAIDPYPFIENCPDQGQGYVIGGPGGLLDETESRRAGKVAATQRVEAAGNHELKAGVDAEDNRLNKKRLISGNAVYTVLLDRNQTEIFRYVELAPPDSMDPRFNDVCGRSGAAMDESRACDYEPPPDVNGQTFNWAAFAQDSWQIRPNLTFNAGVRYEEQRMRFAEDLQNTTDPFTGNRLQKNAMVLQNMWAPRVGLLYDWTKEGRSKVYSSFGRFYESIPMNINDRSFGGESSMRTTYDHSACGPVDPTIGGPTGPSCPQDPMAPPLSEQLFGSGVLVAPGIDAQYMDEFILGSEYEVLEDLKVGAAWKNRRIGEIIEDVSTDNAATYILANPGRFPEEEERKIQNQIDALPMGDPERGRLEAQLEQFRGIRVFDPPKRDHNAIELTAMKRFSKNFFIQGSYTYSRTIGNYQGLFTANNGQVDPNINSQYDLIELLANRDGPLPQDRPHYFKVDSFYRFDLEEAGVISTGGRFRALSGTPVGAFGRHYRYGNDEALLLPRGSLGRVQFDLGLDGQVGYGRDIGRGMHLEAFVQLFNMLAFESLRGQGTFFVDETYTIDPANPIVGGDYEDLVYLKQLTRNGGAETNLPVTRNRNFQNPTARYGAPYGVLGARLTF